MPGDVRLAFSCGDYDRTRPLLDGAVKPEGIALECVPLEPNEIFRRMLLDEAFDVSEMSLSNYIMERGQGSRRFVAIPVFLSRAFRHSNIYVNKASGIRCAGDLRGKRIGLSEYHTTMALWLRGILEDEYDVSPKEIEWLTGGVEKPGRSDRMAGFEAPSGVRIGAVPEAKCLGDMLRAGEIDALFHPRKPACFDNETVVRLWGNYRGLEEDYFGRTGIFPIMHVVVMRREIHERYPWAAESLYRAFTKAKDAALAKFATMGTLPASLPWAFSEAERTEKLMGKDFWPYGLEKNRRVLETMLRYASEQGLCEAPLTPEELFPEGWSDPGERQQ